MLKIQLFLVGLGLSAAAIGIATVIMRLRRDRWLPLGLLALLLYAVLIKAFPGDVPYRAMGGIALAATAGCLLGSRLGSRASLLAFLVTAAGADIVSTLAGPTRALLAQSSDAQRRLLEILAVVVPLAGRRFAVIGLPDVVGVTALFTGLRFINVRPAVATAAPIAAVAAALATALVWRPLPVFPFYAVAALIATAGRDHGPPQNVSDPPPGRSAPRTPSGRSL
jgi:hypothetical protein